MANRRVRAKMDPLTSVMLGGSAQVNDKRTGWMVVATYDQPPVYDAEKMKGLVFQREQAPVCGPHYQIFVEMRERVTTRGVVEALGYPVLRSRECTGLNSAGKANRVSCQVRFGDALKAARYCSSEHYCRTCSAGDSPFFPKDCADGCASARPKGRMIPPEMHGDVTNVTRPGPKHAWALARIKSGCTMQELLEEDPGYVAHAARFIDRALAVYAPRRAFKTQVFWLWGPAGVDKSRLAKAVVQGAYNKPPDTKWFDGYDGEEVVILNDLRKGMFTFNYLLELFDRYPLQVEVKCGYRQFAGRLVIVTCSKGHADLWGEIAGHENENLAQLTRRITKEVRFPLSKVGKQALLFEMRSALVSSRELGREVDSEFPVWDGTGAVPEPGVQARALGELASAGVPCVALNSPELPLAVRAPWAAVDDATPVAVLPAAGTPMGTPPPSPTLSPTIGWGSYDAMQNDAGSEQTFP